MLVNVKAIKQRIKDAGLRSNKETILIIDKKVDQMLSEIITRAKIRNVKTLKEEDVM